MDKIFKEKSIVILNIPFRTRKNIIRIIFSKFGKIEKIKLLEMKNKKHLMCFIKFQEEIAVDWAVEVSGELYLSGKKIIIRKAYHYAAQRDIIRVVVRNNYYNPENQQEAEQVDEVNNNNQ